jgi:hypothetical protein
VLNIHLKHLQRRLANITGAGYLHALHARSTTLAHSCGALSAGNTLWRHRTATRDYAQRQMGVWNNLRLSCGTRSLAKVPC